MLYTEIERKYIDSYIYLIFQEFKAFFNMGFQTIYLCLFSILSNALTPYDHIEEKKQQCLRKQLQVHYDLV